MSIGFVNTDISKDLKSNIMSLMAHATKIKWFEEWIKFLEIYVIKIKKTNRKCQMPSKGYSYSGNLTVQQNTGNGAQRYWQSRKFNKLIFNISGHQIAKIFHFENVKYRQ